MENNSAEAIFIVIVLASFILWLVDMAITKKRINAYKFVANRARLTYQQENRDWKEVYGEASSVILPGGDRTVITRLLGLLIGSAQGEICEVKCSVLEHTGTGDLVFRSSGSYSKEHIEFDGDERREEKYTCAVFNLGISRLPDFNISYESLAGLKYLNTKGPLSNIITQEVASVLAHIPLTSIAFAGGLLVFYELNLPANNLENFIKYTSLAAETILYPL